MSVAQAVLLEQKCFDTELHNLLTFFGNSCGADAVILKLLENPSETLVGLCDPIRVDPILQRLHRQIQKWNSEKNLNIQGAVVAFHKTEKDGRYYSHFALHHDQSLYGLLGVAVPAEKSDILKNPKTSRALLSLTKAAIDGACAAAENRAEISVMMEQTNSLIRQNQIDDLTKLENKSSFQGRCQERLTNQRQPAAMLAFDLDRFKQVNDVYGHLFGDEYLRRISEALSRTLPQKSIIGRTGGDEFCALIDVPETGHNFLRSVVRHVRLSIQRSMATLGKPDLGGISIGISLFPKHGTNYRDLHSLADCALYASKRSDRNSTTIFSEELEGLIEPANLRDGRSNFEFDRLKAHLQPIVETQSGAVQGFEVLARLQDGKGRLSNPESFSWMFRDHRFASSLTFQVVENALEQLCNDCGISSADLPDLWINVTDSDFLNSDFVFDFQAVLERFGADWSKIIIEVNEETIIGPRNGLVFNALTEINRRGGRIALDDFGVGQTGLTHACQWPIDIIKVDQSLIRRLHCDQNAKVLVEAINLVARRLGQQVLAEGVETQGQLDHATELGCSLAQGYLIARPQAAADALGLTRELETS